jgi:tetratricopeptide (TPR) repeat protein
VHANLSNAYGVASRWADAARELDAGLKLRPERRDAVAQLFYYQGARDGLPPDELNTLRGELDRTHADAKSLTRAAEWCVTHHALDAARAALEHVEGLGSNGYALRLLSEVDRKQSRLPEAVAHARAAIEHGEPKARIELVYALADSALFDEALKESEAPLDDPVASALLRGAKGYTLIRMGRQDEGAAEAEAAMRVIEAQSPQ